MAGSSRAAARSGCRRRRSGDRSHRPVGRRGAPDDPARSGTTPRARSRRRPCRSCSRRRWRARPMRSRWCCEDQSAHLWRARCARQPAGASPARARRRSRDRGGAVRSSARSRCWSGCSASSRPAAPICRSTPATRAERLAFMLADAGAPVLVTQVGAVLIGCRRSDARIVRLDADWPTIAAHPSTAPAVGARSPQHRLRHLYLGLDRNTKGRRGRSRGIAASSLTLEQDVEVRPASAICAADSSALRRRGRGDDAAAGLVAARR